MRHNRDDTHQLRERPPRRTLPDYSRARDSLRDAPIRPIQATSQLHDKSTYTRDKTQGHGAPDLQLLTTISAQS